MANQGQLPAAALGGGAAAVLPPHVAPAQFAANRGNAMAAVYAAQTPAAIASFNALNTPVLMAHAMSVATKTMASDARALIFGVTPEAVLVEAYAFLAQARADGSVEGLIRTAVLAVGLGFTVSREWVTEYGNLPAPHMFQVFEIAGRVPATEGANGGVMLDQWVAGSSMNAHAVRIFGHCLVSWAPRGTLLANIGARAGTIFDPPPEVDQSERARLTRDAAAQVTREEEIMVRDAADDFENLVEIVNEIFGQPGASVQQMAAWAQHYPNVTL